MVLEEIIGEETEFQRKIYPLPKITETEYGIGKEFIFPQIYIFFPLKKSFSVLKNSRNISRIIQVENEHVFIHVPKKKNHDKYVKYTDKYLLNFSFVHNQKVSSAPYYATAKFPLSNFLLQLSEKLSYIHLIIKKLLRLKVNATEHKIISIAPNLLLQYNINKT